MYRRKISTAIDDAVRCLPPEICNITVDYVERPHTWTSFETVDIRTTADGATYITGGDTILTTQKRRLLVSSETFATGRRIWTIDYRPTPATIRNGWISVGVTTAAASCVDSNPYDDSNWLLHISDRSGITVVCPNRYDRICGMDPTITRIRVVFYAVLETSTITGYVQFLYLNNNWLSLYPVQLNDKPIDDFLKLRPCVLIDGCNSVVVGSDFITN